ncbi:MAG: hypothetical protein K2L28_06465 [Muribaculaceae bacterium]|nr:hypothetical protein [Muribaculaceae bacterium]
MKKYILALLICVGSVCAAASAQEVDNSDLWKGNNKELQLGYVSGSFDLGADGGKLDSRWGASLKSVRNIYLHRGPIGGFLKFGLHLGTDMSYMNFEKGHGSLSDITSGDFDGDDCLSLGKHYLAIGAAVGPTATFMPFINSSNRNLARLKFRAFFHVVPSYAAYITSSDDEGTDFHSAFCCYFSGGLNVMWRKLNVGVEWKGGRAKYKGLGGSMMGDDVTDLFYDGGKIRYGSKMFSVNIGFAF